MRVVLDTSVIVEIDRKNEETISLIKRLIDKNHEIFASTVTVSEILAGSYLRKDFKRAVAEAKRIMGQFIWVDLDAKIAEKTAQYIACLIAEGKIIEYQDTAIAATSSVIGADYIITLNKAHFESVPGMKGKVFTPTELRKILG